jgi:hypothetical protein
MKNKKEEKQEKLKHRALEFKENTSFSDNIKNCT